MGVASPAAPARTLFSRPRVVVRALVMAGSLIGLLGGPARAQSLSPYPDFQALTLADMDSVRVKLTYGGPLGAKISTLLIARAGTPLSAAPFQPYRRPGFEYSNDEAPIGAAVATERELKGIIEGVGRLPRVTGGSVDPEARVSFALLIRTGAATKAFEAIVNDTTGRDLFAALLAALQNNKDATRKVRAFGCSAAMLPAGPPSDVGSQVTVGFGSLRGDLATRNQLRGKVTISNHSATAVVAPLTLVVICKSGQARLLGEDGFTCAITPAGLPFIEIDVGSALAAGASVERGLRFISPHRAKFDLDFKVFAGPGTR